MGDLPESLIRSKRFELKLSVLRDKDVLVGFVGQTIQKNNFFEKMKK
jgi:hypothetical protein